MTDQSDRDRLDAAIAKAAVFGSVPCDHPSQDWNAIHAAMSAIEKEKPKLFFRRNHASWAACMYDGIESHDDFIAELCEFNFKDDEPLAAARCILAVVEKE